MLFNTIASDVDVQIDLAQSAFLCFAGDDTQMAYYLPLAGVSFSNGGASNCFDRAAETDVRKICLPAPFFPIFKRAMYRFAMLDTRQHMTRFGEPVEDVAR